MGRYSLNSEDFRTILYEKYVSGFKQFINIRDSNNIESAGQIFENRYFPHIKSFSKNAEIIEFGCGPGYLLKYLNDKGFTNTLGLDISGQQVAQAKSKNVNAIVSNVFDFFDNNEKKFDIIFALDFIEHFNKKELLILFDGFSKILNENGLLILHTPNGQGLFSNQSIYGDLTHITIFTPSSLFQILAISDFHEIKFYESGPICKDLKGCFRLILWKLLKIVVYAIRIIETGGKENILTQDFICIAKRK